MDKDTFLLYFGAIYEHSTWIAETVWEQNQGLDSRHDTVDGLGQALAAVFLSAPKPAQLGVLRAHPMLAVRQHRGGLTASSSEEQASAGLDACSSAEYRRFQTLNEAYQKRFGFPFIVAVKGKSRAEILAAFEARIANDPDTEFTNALREVNTIARLRLESM